MKNLSQKSPLKRKSSLKRKSELAKISPNKKTKKRLKLEEKTAQQLVKVADKFHSQYVRLRDSRRRGNTWFGKCITCNHQGIVAYIDEKGVLRFTRGWDNGHFIVRGVLSLRYHEQNTNLQCSFHCNKMKSGNPEKYKLALDNKYGDGTYRTLEDLAMLPGAYKCPTKPELLELIHTCQQYITTCIDK